MPNQLYFGDNLEILRGFGAEFVDLIYLDPPFNSKATYNVLFAERDGTLPTAQIRAFEDTWRWDRGTEAVYRELVEQGGDAAVLLKGFIEFLGRNDMMAYLVMMAPRLVELRRVLRAAGSLYLHCDSTASHYLRILLDAVFGPTNFQNEIIWRRTGSNNAAKRFGPIHQTILFYRKSPAAFFSQPKGPYTKDYVAKFFVQSDQRGRYQAVSLTGPGTRTGESGRGWRHYDPTAAGRHWQPASYVYSKYRSVAHGDNLARYPLLERLDRLDEVGLIHWGKGSETVPRYKFYLDDAPGVPIQDIWAFQPGTEGCVSGEDGAGIDQDVKWLTTKDKERLGYPTQKPEGVLRRIISASTKEGDLVLDPFCGCGTTIAVAEQLGRRWIGIDITHHATNLIKHRLFDAFRGDCSDYEVIGEPVDESGARVLAMQDRHDFQSWALGLVNARVTKGRKGPDRGIDGKLFFNDEGDGGRTKTMVFSVKSGKVSVRDVRDLRGTLERENAEIGVLLTLELPTSSMRSEAIEAGFYKSPWGRYPRVQIITIRELLDETRGIEYPQDPSRETTYRRAPRVRRLPPQGEFDFTGTKESRVPQKAVRSKTAAERAQETRYKRGKAAEG